jgi:hypothetical protein
MYALKFSGCLLGPDRFSTLGAARAALREVIQDEARRCRARLGSAVVVRCTPCMYSIHVTRSRHSPLWMIGSVVKL